MEKAIQAAAKAQAPEVKAKQSINTVMSAVLDGENMRKRFEELLGERTPQFISSLVTMVNDDTKLQQAFYENPMSVIKSALRAASYDLPIDPGLGFAYIMPFNVSYKDSEGNWHKKMEATFVPGYKGLNQLCLRTGAYSRIPDAVDVREGELKRYDRLTGDIEFQWIEDDEEREKLPIVGYAGYFRLKNGAEKTIYMTKKKIEAHEKKHRKGNEMSKGWRENFDEMARKTVIRKLITKYGMMSIQYRDGSEAAVNLMSAAMESEGPDNIPDIEYEDATFVEVDEGTGEVIEPENLFAENKEAKK